MKNKATRLLATFKTVTAFGSQYATDFPPLSIGGQQFTIVANAASSLDSLGSAQVSGSDQVHTDVLTKAAARVHLHDDLLAITTAAHSLALMNTPDIAGKFLMPRNHGDQDLLNTARAFQTDAAVFSSQFNLVGLPVDFLTHLGDDIDDFADAISDKGTTLTTRGGVTGGINDTAQKAAIALHILNTVVKNTYQANPQRLAEWAVASHVEKHTPVPRPPKPTPPPTGP